MDKFRRASMLIALVVILACAFIVLHTIIGSSDKAAVPQVVGLQLTEASEALQKAGFPAKIEKADSSERADVVLSQSVPAGERVKTGKTILLRVSKGGASGRIPDVRSMKVEDAVRILEQAGFKTGKTVRVSDSSKAAGIVIAQNPSSGQKLDVSVPVSLLVSGGSSSENSLVSVPELRGMTVEEAAELLTQSGLAMGTASTAVSAAVPENTVINSAPRAGTKVPAGASVNIEIAKQPVVGTKQQPAVKKAETVKETKQPAQQERKKSPAVAKQQAAEKPEAKAAAAGQEKKAEQKPAVPKAEAKPETKREAKAETKVVPAAVPASPATPSAASRASVKPAAENTKSSNVTYIVPPLTRPMSLKIIAKDANGTREIKNTTVSGNEKISLNVPYAGTGSISILLGGETVWQELLK